MLGIVVAAKGLYSGREIIMCYPHSMYRDHLNYFESVHYNSNLSAVSSQGTSDTEQKGKVLGFPLSVLADLLCPKKELWDHVLDVSIENLRFISNPVSLDSGLQLRKVKIERAKSKELANEVWIDQAEHLSCINVVAVYNTDDTSGHDLEAVKLAMRRLCGSLKFEQSRCNFLNKEVSSIKAVSRNDCNRETQLLGYLQNSMLARHVRDIYFNFLHGRGCDLLINN